MKKILLLAFAAIVLFAACRTPAPATPPPPPVTPQTPEEETLAAIYERFWPGLILTGATNYTVRQGDTLADIAWKLYDDGFMYPVILLASRYIVLDPDRILPGMVLIVPDLQRNLNDAEARRNIRNFLLEIATFEDSRNRPATAEGIRERANRL